MVDTMKTCKYCGYEHAVILNTYKHYAVVCGSCNNVVHIKKEKYFFEYFIPRTVAKKFLPLKAFLRLFSDRGDFDASEFYDSTSFESTEMTTWRKSEVQQVFDQLGLIDFTPNRKNILDISGGPGNVGNALAEQGARVTVTEYSDSAVLSMNNNLNVTAARFNYLTDSIHDVVDGEYDLIMVRSSIIFCPNLDRFVKELKGLLKPGGVVLIESILPSVGEILWWQQLEYKFPFIYSQETIEKTFYKNGLYLKHGYHDYGGYVGVKYRSYKTISRQLFTWLVDYPMVLFYYLNVLIKKPPIDNSLSHKMLTQFWVDRPQDVTKYKSYKQGGENKSKTFGYTYNGYLRH